MGGVVVGVECGVGGLGGFLVLGVLRTSAFGKDKLKTAHAKILFCKNLSLPCHAV